MFEIWPINIDNVTGEVTSLEGCHFPFSIRQQSRVIQDLIESGSHRRSSDGEETVNCLPNHKEQCAANNHTGTTAGDAKPLKDIKAQEIMQAPQTRAPPSNARFDQSGTFRAIDYAHLISSRIDNRHFSSARRIAIFSFARIASHVSPPHLSLICNAISWLKRNAMISSIP
jgi:hypothetical protein